MAVLAWKSKQEMNPLGVRLFSTKVTVKNTRLASSSDISPPVPGFQTLPLNLLAKVWNNVPGLQAATTLGAAKILARKWARTIP